VTEKILMVCYAAVVIAGPAFGQVELKAYAGPDGYLDVQKLTCAQLAGTFQEDADYLAAWYSGWYNGLAKKHVMLVSRTKSLQHEVIVYCKANPGKKVIEAIDVVFKDYREDQGIKIKQ
jgi:HdeA/HdeB family